MSDDLSDAAVWPCWHDALGQRYEPGDRVAIATVNGKSPQLVIGEVIRINRMNSRGEPIMDRRFLRAKPGQRSHSVEYESATITVQPLVDGRGFLRWSARGGKAPRAVTYQYPQNIIKV